MAANAIPKKVQCGRRNLARSRNLGRSATSSPIEGTDQWQVQVEWRSTVNRSTCGGQPVGIRKARILAARLETVKR